MLFLLLQLRNGKNDLTICVSQHFSDMPCAAIYSISFIQNNLKWNASNKYVLKIEFDAKNRDHMSSQQCIKADFVLKPIATKHFCRVFQIFEVKLESDRFKIAADVQCLRIVIFFNLSKFFRYRHQYIIIDLAIVIANTISETGQAD